MPSQTILPDPEKLDLICLQAEARRITRRPVPLLLRPDALYVVSLPIGFTLATSELSATFPGREYPSPCACTSDGTSAMRGPARETSSLSGLPGSRVTTRVAPTDWMAGSPTSRLLLEERPERGSWRSSE